MRCALTFLLVAACASSKPAAPSSSEPSPAPVVSFAAPAEDDASARTPEAEELVEVSAPDASAPAPRTPGSAAVQACHGAGA